MVARSGGDSYHYQVRFDYGLALGFAPKLKCRRFLVVADGISKYPPQVCAGQWHRRFCYSESGVRSGARLPFSRDKVVVMRKSV